VEPEVQAEQPLVVVVAAAVDDVKMAIQIQTPVLEPQGVLASAFALHTSTRSLVVVLVSSEVLVRIEGHEPVDLPRLHGVLPGEQG
jgi:hypothetical protein